MKPEYTVHSYPDNRKKRDNKVLYKMRIQKKMLKNIRWYTRDIYNRLKYGSEAPICCEKISIAPSAVTHHVVGGNISRSDSGSVLGGDWDLSLREIEKSPKYRICHQRFVNGKTWKEAGAYRLMMDLIKKKPGVDGCRTIDDIKKRYEHVDILYHRIAEEKKMMSRSEMHPGNFRESNGVYVHIDRTGQIVFGNGGWHRLAIAKILRLELIPAQIGVVHENAVAFWRSRLL